MSRLRFAAPLFIVGLLSSSVLLGDDKKTEKEPIIVTNVKLPTHYRDLGLSKKQRGEVLKIRAKYAVEVQKLKEQIAALTEQERSDVENLLTAAQKARLRELRGGGTVKDSGEKEKGKEIDKPAGDKKK